MAAGPFERNGIRPTSMNVSSVTRIEATRAVIAYLAGEGLLDEVAWGARFERDRDAWAKALHDVLQEATKKASKEAVEELAGWEALALLLRCRRCGAEEEEPCRDMRLNVIKHNKHPHQERMDDMEAS